MRQDVTMLAMDKNLPSSDLNAFARHFVRDRLGCGCPDNLLDRIEIDIRPGPQPMTTLSVGGRLLVHIRNCPGTARLPHQLAGWLAEGVAQRDTMGFNRFRLVLVTGNQDAVRPSAEALFATWGGDERAHLHLVSPSVTGPLLPAAPG